MGKSARKKTLRVVTAGRLMTPVMAVAIGAGGVVAGAQAAQAAPPPVPAPPDGDNAVTTIAALGALVPGTVGANAVQSMPYLIPAADLAPPPGWQVPAPQSRPAPAQPAPAQPPLPVRNPERGLELPSVTVPEFAPPGYGEASRDTTREQAKLAVELGAYARDNNPATIASSGTAKRTIGKVAPAVRQNQSVMVTRNTSTGTLDVEISRRRGEVVTGLPETVSPVRYANQELDRTTFKMTPPTEQRFRATGEFPDYTTMNKGDTIIRIPAQEGTRASELIIGRKVGNYVEFQPSNQYSENPALQYQVTALGEGSYAVTYGDGAFDRTRGGMSLWKAGGTTDRWTSSLHGIEVMYDTNTRQGREGMDTSLRVLETGQRPTLAPGQIYSTVDTERHETLGNGSAAAGLPKLWTSPDLEGSMAASRTASATTTTTLMRTPDGDTAHGEPLGWSSVETTRLGSGGAAGDLSGKAFGVNYGGDTVPADITVRTVTDGGRQATDVTFSLAGNKFTMTQGELNQRARELAQTDPELVADNRVLQDLAKGVSLRTAMKDPEDPLVAALTGVSNKEVNGALETLYQPPMPEQNPFVPTVPERNPLTAPAPPAQPETQPGIPGFDQNPIYDQLNQQQPVTPDLDPPMPQQNPFVPPVPERNPLTVPPVPPETQPGIPGFEWNPIYDQLDQQPPAAVPAPAPDLSPPLPERSPLTPATPDPSPPLPERRSELPSLTGTVVDVTTPIRTVGIPSVPSGPEAHAGPVVDYSPLGTASSLGGDYQPAQPIQPIQPMEPMDPLNNDIGDAGSLGDPSGVYDGSSLTDSGGGSYDLGGGPDYGGGGAFGSDFGGGDFGGSDFGGGDFGGGGGSGGGF